MNTTRRRRLRARPLLVAVGALSLTATAGCSQPLLGRTACHDDCGGGGVDGGGSDDLAIPTPPADLKPPGSD